MTDVNFTTFLDSRLQAEIIFFPLNLRQFFSQCDFFQMRIDETVERIVHNYAPIVTGGLSGLSFPRLHPISCP